MSGLLAVPGIPAANAVVILTPVVSGVFNNGNGVNSHWVQVQNTWRGPSAFSQSYGGISSIADANAALGLTSADPGFMRSADAVMGTVNAGNDVYNTQWGATWGTANMPPLFNTGDLHQENYAGHVTGYIAVTQPGDYNFGVMADDGFSFAIQGANGSESMSLDGMNPRDRYGFGPAETSRSGNAVYKSCNCDLALQQGLYRFDLVGYNRQLAGVLNLGWWLGPNTSNFETIPQQNLYTAAPSVPVPLPGALWLMVSGLVGLGTIRTRRRRG
ncbi:MAG TPA: hypothetical protein PLO69_13790 [Gammaproteobacteria bacterium]|nr:hypothetical protein [Gammaproteobacteria bacterium]